jgi:type IV pilus assembly protein PilM
MPKPRVGVDVGSTAVRAAELSEGSPPTLVRAAQVRLGPGIVENGEIRNVEALADAMRELWQRGGFKSKQVVMGVGNQRVIVREITLPSLPEKELRESLPFQVQEFIPLPVDEAILDFDVIEEFTEEGRKLLRLLLVAAQRDMVGGLVNAASAAKLDPVGVDLVPFALVRSIGTPGGLGLDSDPGGEAVIDIGADVTNICVHEAGTPRFVRILPSGGRDVTVAIARALGMEDDAAEAAKRGGTEIDAHTREEVDRVAFSRAGTFVDEVRSSLDFYLAQTPGARIQRVVVSGGGSKLAGLLDLLRERLSTNVDRGHPFEKVNARLNLPDEELREAEPVLAVAVGLALPSEDR